MMKLVSLVFIVLFSCAVGYSQVYEFTTVKDLQALPVISQDNTGACWSFSTSSFLESEIMRETGKKIDISEMFFVRETYLRKAQNYVFRQGKTQFGEGGLNHDVILTAIKYGIEPQSAYTGLLPNETAYDHSKMEPELESFLKDYADPSKNLGANWKNGFPAILDKYMGKPPEEFEYEGQKYTPQSFLAYTKLNLNDYVTITSFTQAPFYKPFILEIPDNFSSQSFYNLPLDEFVQNIDNALDKGFTVALDSDVSEKTFSGSNGIAVIPENSTDSTIILSEIKPEKKITQEYRQQEFENFDTQDDHLMHIVGEAKDQKGNVYYKVKNSWGDKSLRKGYVYMSVSYLRLKAISVMMHKDALLPKTREELGVR